MLMQQSVSTLLPEACQLLSTGPTGLSKQTLGNRLPEAKHLPIQAMALTSASIIPALQMTLASAYTAITDA